MNGKHNKIKYARVAEMADALDLGSQAGNTPLSHYPFLFIELARQIFFPDPC